MRLKFIIHPYINTGEYKQDVASWIISIAVWQILKINPCSQSCGDLDLINMFASCMEVQIAQYPLHPVVMHGEAIGNYKVFTQAHFLFRSILEKKTLIYIL